MIDPADAHGRLSQRCADDVAAGAEPKWRTMRFSLRGGRPAIYLNGRVDMTWVITMTIASVLPTATMRASPDR